MTNESSVTSHAGAVTRARKVRPKLAAITRGHAHTVVTG